MGRGEGRKRRKSEQDSSPDASRQEPRGLIYLTVEEAITLHAEMLGIAGPASANLVRDWNLLDSALARPQNAALYEGASFARQAATLLWGIVKNHPFIDGNKRAAHLIATTFAEVNGYDVVATEDEQFDLLLRVAAEMLDVEAVETWFANHLAPQRALD